MWVPVAKWSRNDGIFQIIDVLPAVGVWKSEGLSCRISFDGSGTQGNQPLDFWVFWKLSILCHSWKRWSTTQCLFCVLFWFPQIWDTKPLETPFSADMIRGTPRRAVILERNKGTPKKPCFTMSRNVKPNTKTTSPVEFKLQFHLPPFISLRPCSQFLFQTKFGSHLEDIQDQD